MRDHDLFFRQREYVDVIGFWLNEDEILKRYDPTDYGFHQNTVRGWPSSGDIIIAQGVHPVELKYIQVNRFASTARSPITTVEDEFCMRLRSIGGKWWKDYVDFQKARICRIRTLYSVEQDIVYLGWPKDGGVWVLHYSDVGNRTIAAGRGIPIGTIYNALTMEERCDAIRACGGHRFEDPLNSEHVRPLLEGFGQHEEWEMSTDGGAKSRELDVVSDGFFFRVIRRCIDTYCSYYESNASSIHYIMQFCLFVACR